MLHSELFSETTQEVRGSGLLSKQNSKMVKADLGSGQLLARQGAMVAYQGNVSFEHEGMSFDGAGLKKLVKKALTGEGLTLMRVQGDGEVFFADNASDVHIIDIENDRLSVNGMNILAFSDTLSWDIEMVRSGAAVSGGLFNTILAGSGQAAVVTHGSPVALEVGQVPTYADPDAVVCWSAGLKVSYQASMSFKSLIGRSSGETGQLAFSGNGMVLVQPAENMRYGGNRDQAAQEQQQSSPLGGLGRFLG